MKIGRIFLAFITAVSALSSSLVPVSAARIDNGGIVSPLYNIAQAPVVSLAIVNETGYCNSDVKGIDAVSISALQSLEKKQDSSTWTTVDGAVWSSTVESKKISMTNSISGLSSGSYRVKTIFTLKDKYGKIETITVYSDEKSC